MMDAILMILLTLQITTITSRKQHSSSESIENLLYYKDCKHKKKDPPPVQVLRANPPPKPSPPACPCPKMCCSMCCECTTPMSFLERQMNMPVPPQSEMMQPFQAQPSPPKQPPIQTPVQPQLAQRKRKRVRPGFDPKSMMKPPIGGRRDLGFTRDNIKTLIAQDSDLKKILKDLVTVTMKKVDLLEIAKTRKSFDNPEPTSPEPVNKSELELEDDEYDD